jgi:hypothetical protein
VQSGTAGSIVKHVSVALSNLFRESYLYLRPEAFVLKVRRSAWPKVGSAWRKEMIEPSYEKLATPLRGRVEIGCQARSSSSNALASFKSTVSKPSVNQA